MANEQIKAGAKWLPKMRQLRFNSQQISLVFAVLEEANSKMESIYLEKAYMLFMSLMGNVLTGNNYLDEKTVKEAFQECFELFNEINEDTLDWEDVVKHNEQYSGVTIALDHFDDIKTTGTNFCKVKDIVPIKERVRNIIKSQGEDIDSLEEAAKCIDNAETLVGVRSYRKMWQMIKKDLEEANVI